MSCNIKRIQVFVFDQTKFLSPFCDMQYKSQTAILEFFFVLKI